MRIMSSKSQASLEFIVIIGLLILMSLIIIVFSLNEQNNIVETKRDLIKYRECQRISSVANAVYNAGEGSAAKIYTNYSVEFRKSSIKISDKISDKECSVAAEVSPRNISGNIKLKNIGNKINISSA